MRVPKKQIRAARVLLGWTQQELGKKVGVIKDTISRIESGSIEGSAKTMGRIVDILEKAGIEFLEDGVRKPTLKSIVIDKGDPDWFCAFLDDVIETLKEEAEPEFIIYGVDDRLTKPQAIDRFRELRRMGVKMRFFIKQGDTFMRADEREYRYIPEELFLNYNTFIYANKVCHDIREYCLLVINEELAATERNKIDVLWEKCDPVTERSTADVRY